MIYTGKKTFEILYLMQVGSVKVEANLDFIFKGFDEW